MYRVLHGCLVVSVLLCTLCGCTDLTTASGSASDISDGSVGVATGGTTAADGSMDSGRTDMPKTGGAAQDAGMVDANTTDCVARGDCYVGGDPGAQSACSKHTDCVDPQGPACSPAGTCVPCEDANACAAHGLSVCAAGECRPALQALEVTPSANPAFVPSGFEYSLTLSVWQPTFSLTATTEQAQDKLSIDGAAVASGQTTESELAPQVSKAIELRVERDGRSNQYKVEVERPLGLQSMSSPAPADAHFGGDLAVDGDTLLVQERATVGYQVHVFEREGGSWTFATTLRPTTPGTSRRAAWT